MTHTSDIKIETKLQLETIVLGMAVNDVYHFPNFRYTRISFECESDGEFSWTAESDHRSGYIFPLKNSNDIKTFKTLAGAKRNFINYISFLF